MMMVIYAGGDMEFLVVLRWSGIILNHIAWMEAYTMFYNALRLRQLVDFEFVVRGQRVVKAHLLVDAGLGS